jgi:nitrite reductase/ring-hydroxylating ferredoxin subunit/uncharacterized membrane protein
VDSRVVSDTLNQQEWLLPVAEKMQDAITATFEAGGPAGKTAEDVLNGVWLGHPLHSAIVTVPVGAWTAAAVLDALDAGGKTELGPGADAAIAVGLVGAVGAAASGAAQWHSIKEKSVQSVGATHAMLNVTATALFGASLLVRRGGNRPLGRLLSWTGLGINLASAWLGGSLSYEQRLGMDHAPRGKSLPTEGFVPVLPEIALPQNQLTRAEADGVPLVLLRRGEKIHALAARCAHYGGPLDEGEIVDDEKNGPCVKCPWHGSCFSFANGQIVDGPSTFPQPLFETRIRAGQVEVRAPKIPQNVA